MFLKLSPPPWFAPGRGNEWPPNCVILDQWQVIIKCIDQWKSSILELFNYLLLLLLMTNEGPVLPGGWRSSPGRAGPPPAPGGRLCWPRSGWNWPRSHLPRPEEIKCFYFIILFSFLAPSGAQGVTLSVCAVQTRTLNFHLSGKGLQAALLTLSQLIFSTLYL